MNGYGYSFSNPTRTVRLLIYARNGSTAYYTAAKCSSDVFVYVDLKAHSGAEPRSFRCPPYPQEGTLPIASLPIISPPSRIRHLGCNDYDVQLHALSWLRHRLGLSTHLVADPRRLLTCIDTYLQKSNLKIFAQCFFLQMEEF